MSKLYIKCMGADIAAPIANGYNKNINKLAITNRSVTMQR